MKFTVQYYDIVLLAILGSLVLGMVVGIATTVPLVVSIPLTAVIGFAIIYQTIFLRGPVESASDLAEDAHEFEVLE